jgi:hypothetical protein
VLLLVLDGYKEFQLDYAMHKDLNQMDRIRTCTISLPK